MFEFIQILKTKNSTRRFVSLTHIDQEISLIWDTETFHNFDQTYLLTTLDEVWIPIKRVAKQGFQETGVVSAIVTPLKKFSILYLSSFSTSYFLVRQKEYPSCLQTLTNNQFQILEAKK